MLQRLIFTYLKPHLESLVLLAVCFRFKQISDGMIGLFIGLFGIGINAIAIHMLSRRQQ